MAGPSSCVLKIAPALEVSSLVAPAPTRVTRDSSPASPLSAAISVFVDLGAGSSFDTAAAMVGRSLTALVRASSTLSHSCAVVVLAESLPGGTSDADAPNNATFSRQLAITRRQRDANRQELVSVRSELHRVRDENYRCVQLWLTSMCLSMSSFCRCWRCCPGLTL